MADPVQEAQFFKDLGVRIKALREKADLSQEDMLSRGYSVRYWQKVEAGKPITLRTLLRICRLFSAPMHQVVRGLDGHGSGGRVPSNRNASAGPPPKRKTTSKS